MKLTELKLIYFKNHKRFDWSSDVSVLGLCGLNGVGKTNVLDSIHFLCVGKSYFSGTDVQCIQDGMEGSTITAFIEDELRSELKLTLKRGARKKLEHNGKPYKRILEHLGKFFCVIIAPRDIELIYGTNEVRRTFINQILCQKSSKYAEHLVHYSKLITQRNSLLKSDFFDGTLLDTLDDQIEPIVRHLYEERALFFEAFEPLLKEAYAKLSDDDEKIAMNYVSTLSDGSYKEQCSVAREKDKILQRSTVGIHKDEIEIKIDDFPLKKYGSQGQIKSALIAIKLAEYNVLLSHSGKTPLLLLDDIFEKIDHERATRLTGIIKNGNFGQIFITDTHPERIEAFCKNINKSYEVVNLH